MLYHNPFRHHPFFRSNADEINSSFLTAEIVFKTVAINRSFKQLFAQHVVDVDAFDVFGLDVKCALGRVGINGGHLLIKIRYKTAIFDDGGEVIMPLGAFVGSNAMARDSERGTAASLKHLLKGKHGRGRGQGNDFGKPAAINESPSANAFH